MDDLPEPANTTPYQLGSALSAGPHQAAEAHLPRFVSVHLRRNFTLLAADYGLFHLGTAFASTATIVPALAERLGASNLLIGAIPSVMTLGYALPPLFAANYTERLPRKLGFILKGTVWERLPLLAMAGVTYFYAVQHPSLVLAAILILLGILAGIGGFLMPAWMDMIGKVVPTTYRGRLFAFGSTVGTGLGLGAALVAGYYLEVFDFPLSYSLCFATGFFFLVLSFICLALVVEPELASSKPLLTTSQYIRRLPDVLATDRNFTWYLAGRALSIVGTMANGFYTVFALRNLQAPEYEVARFTFFLLAGQTVANIVFGYLADHQGHKPVLVLGNLALVLGNALALASTGMEHMYGVFVFMAIATSATTVSALTISMEFAPEAERPTYLGLATTLVAPLTLLAPLAGGLLADYLGYSIVFAGAGVAALAGLWVLAAKVRDPRRSPIPSL